MRLARGWGQEPLFDWPYQRRREAAARPIATPTMPSKTASGGTAGRIRRQERERYGVIRLSCRGRWEPLGLHLVCWRGRLPGWHNRGRGWLPRSQDPGQVLTKALVLLVDGIACAHRSATIWCRQSGDVIESGTIQAISSRTMQPKPRLNFLSTCTEMT